MDTQPAFTFKDLLTHVIGGVVKAVSERAGEPASARVTRAQAAAHAALGFRPRDIAEAMLASHCLMLHEMMVDSVRATLRGEPIEQRRVSRSAIVAMDRSFGVSLTKLLHLQARWAQAEPETPVVDDLGETDIADRARRHQSATPPRADHPAEPPPPAPEEPVSPLDIGIDELPSEDLMAACRANPEAMAAIDAGDPARFARAMGVEVPSDAYIAAASGPMAAMALYPVGDHITEVPARDLATPFVGNRQARRHPNP